MNKHALESKFIRQFDFCGKNFLVTGASSGIGREISLLISSLGGTLVITGRNTTKLKQTYDMLSGTNHIMSVADLSIDSDIEKLADGIEFNLDGIVHSAGILMAHPAKYISQENINEVFRVNFSAPVLLMTELFKKKRINKGGSVVFISSFSATYPYALGSLYTSSKSALENYAKTLAIENTGLQLRVNCVSPALVKTSMYDITMNSTTNIDASKRKVQYENLYPLGIGEPEDVANLVVFMLSTASKWITGQNFIIDGGYLLGLTSRSFD